MDRFTQNLRRFVGWDVQYFVAVEPWRRSAALDEHQQSENGDDPAHHPDGLLHRKRLELQ